MNGSSERDRTGHAGAETRPAPGGRQRSLAVLRRPDARSLVLAGFIARLPVGMTGLAIVLVIQQRTHSFGDAGLAAGMFWLLGGCAYPLQGRLVDRHGQARVLVPCILVFSAALGALDVVAGHPPRWVAPACGAVAGAAFPPISASVRTLLAAVTDGTREQIAALYTVESIAQELFYLCGPLLVALLAMLASGAIIAGTVAAGLAGTIWLASLPAVRQSPGSTPAAGGRYGRPLASPAVRTLLVTAALTGAVLGSLEIAVLALSVSRSAPAAAGPLLAVVSAGSITGGLVAGARFGADRVVRQFAGFAGAFAVALAVVAATPSVPLAAVGLLVAGMPVAPMLACSYSLMRTVAPPGRQMEAFSWMSVATAAGSAGGLAACGLLLQRLPAPALFLVLAACAGAIPVCLGIQRPRLRPFTSGGLQ
ncbi:MAG TPA: MFS transporter [Candidatus Dormibacteraeota bacterium]|nr:MFS transporter [Candidatus Dormibacteraeota bacterium]